MLQCIRYTGDSAHSIYRAQRKAVRVRGFYNTAANLMDSSSISLYSCSLLGDRNDIFSCTLCIARTEAQGRAELGAELHGETDHLWVSQDAADHNKRAQNVWMPLSWDDNV